MRAAPRSGWITLALLAVAASLPLQAGAGANCELRVVWDPYEPYSYSLGDDSAPVGLDIEVVSRAAALSGCSVSFRKMEWGDILAALRNGEADITAGTGYKPERAAWSWYSESYRKEVIGLLIRKGTAGEFAGDDLDAVFATGFVFGKTTDDTYGIEAAAVFEKYPRQVLSPVSENANIERLLDGTIDGFLVEVNVARSLMDRTGVGERLEFHPLSFDAGDYRLQMSRKTVSPVLFERIDAAVRKLKSDGWIESRNVAGENVQ